MSGYANLEAFVKITAVDVFDMEPDMPETSYQISIDCKALDSQTNIYDLNAHYFWASPTDKDKILSKLITGTIWILKGAYVMFYDECGEFNISIYDPSFEPIDSMVSTGDGVTPKFVKKCFNHTGDNYISDSLQIDLYRKLPTNPRKQIEKLKQELFSLGPVLPGKIFSCKNICAPKKSALKKQDKTAPYCLLKFGAQAVSLFINNVDLNEVKERTKRYKKFKKLTAELIRAYVDLARAEGAKIYTTY